MSDLFFKTNLQLVLDYSNLSKLLSMLLIEAGGIIAGVQMESYSLMDSETARFSRVKKLRRQNMGQFVETCGSGYSALHLYSIKASTSSGAPQVIVSIDTKPSPLLGNRHSLHISGPRELYDQEAIVKTCQQITEAFAVAYGAMFGGNHDYVASLTSWIPIGSVNDLYYEMKHGRTNSPKRQFEDEVLFYQPLQDQFDEKVPRAAWGNILSARHITELGGLERVREESGCYKVELWGNDLYLQLTESLWDVSTEDLTRLNEYFEPIRFPRSPKPIFL